MALAPFFERVWGALGGHLAVSRETLNAVLDTVTVGIHIGRELTENDRWIGELCVNLAARLYPRIVIQGPESYCAGLRQLAFQINPNIEIVESAASECAPICIALSDEPEGIYPSAQGWVARVSHRDPVPSGSPNPYAAGFAAALAIAELFKRVFKKSPPENDVSVSLLNYDKTTGANSTVPKHDLGEILFVGVGAVGNAALWALARDEQTRGTLCLVDPELVTVLNLQRYCLATMTDVEKPKVLLAQSALRQTHWRAEPYQMTLEQFAREHPSRVIPSTAVSVDNVDGRRSAQALMPRLVVSGWTGGDALGASWHEFARNAACLACLYHPHGKGLSGVEQAAKALGLTPDRAALLWITHRPLVDSDIHTAAMTLGVKDSVLMPWRGKTLGHLYTEVVCGAVPMDITGVGKLEIVPLAHQSALAGLMMAAELLKRTHARLASLSQTEPLTSWDNVLQGVPEIWNKPRAREPGCICGDPDYQRVYQEKWRRVTSARSTKKNRSRSSQRSRPS